MSDQKQGGDDLFDIDTNSDLTTEEANSTDSESKPKTEAAIRNRNAQIKAWSDKIERGEVELDALPKNLNWLKPFVSDELQTRYQSKDVDSLVEAKLAKIRAEENHKAEEQRFQKLKLELNSTDMEEDNKKLIQANYERLKSKGLSSADALEEATMAFRDAKKAGEGALAEMKKRMQIPLKTKTVAEDKPDFGTDAFFKSGDSKSRVAEMERVLRGQK